MQLITLNIWGGHIDTLLLKFIEQHRHVDIFCFQEVYHEAKQKISTEDKIQHLTIFSEIAQRLPEHTGYFRPVVDNIYGIGLFVKNSIDVLSEGEIIIHDNPNYPGLGPTHSRNLQWVKCRAGTHEYAVINIHGLWNGQGKSDCPERIAQSQRIKTFVDTINTPKILCGDFNLKPNTESLQIIEEGMDNLITRYNITSTRTRFYPKEEKHADYILISPDIDVNTFEVLKDEVSDHAPLFLDFF